MFLGSALFVFFQTFPDPTTMSILAGERKAEEILPFFIISYLPPGLVGLVIAAAVAAAMSSLDSSINAIATVSTHEHLLDQFVTELATAAVGQEDRLGKLLMGGHRAPP